jgi:hypothetical protein
MHYRAIYSLNSKLSFTPDEISGLLKDSIEEYEGNLGMF